MSGRREYAALMARLERGAGASDPWAELHPSAQPDAVRTQRAAVGRRALAQGKAAEAHVAALCDALALSGRLWWVRVPDPYKVVKRPAAGPLQVVPMMRPPATDCVAALAPHGRLVGFEVKSCDVGASSWAYSELTSGQAASLEAARLIGGLACVVLVVMEADTIARAVYVLPWAEGGLPFASERRSFPLREERAATYRVATPEAWIDTLQRHANTA